jgi:hypothetical protein
MGQTRIPIDVTFKHYLAIEGILQHVIQDLEASVGPEPKWVSCRLNQTGVRDPKPFFFGWIENEALRNIRKAQNRPDPGPFRFLADTPAVTYSNSLKNPAGVYRQDWKGTHQRSLNPPILEELKLYVNGGYFQLPKDHETCRLSIAIKAGNLYVGTLNTGLTKDPGTALDKKIKDWGQADTSELVQYVKNEFDL